MNAKEFLISKGYNISAITHPQDKSQTISEINLFDLMEDYHKAKVENLGLFDVLGSLRTCPTSACRGILINHICNNCGAKW